MVVFNIQIKLKHLLTLDTYMWASFTNNLTLNFSKKILLNYL